MKSRILKMKDYREVDVGPLLKPFVPDEAELAAEMNEKGLSFSNDASQDMSVCVDAVREILDLAYQAVCEDDAEIASHVEPLEEVIDVLTDRLKVQHIERLRPVYPGAGLHLQRLHQQLRAGGRPLLQSGRGRAGAAGQADRRRPQLPPHPEKGRPGRLPPAAPGVRGEVPPPGEAVSPPLDSLLHTLSSCKAVPSVLG